MKHTCSMAIGMMLAVAFTVVKADADCGFMHPATAKEVKVALVQPFVPCGICIYNPVAGYWYEGEYCGSDADCEPSGICQPGNSATDIGVRSCQPPQTYNELVGSPSNGWLWGPESSGTVSFKAATNRLVGGINPPDTVDVAVRIDLRNIRNAGGLVDGVGVLSPGRRTTFKDRAGGPMTVVDLEFPSFRVPVEQGRAHVRTSANVVLNEAAIAGPPGCTSLEMRQLQLLDENGVPFGVPGIFLPPVSN